MYIYVNLLIINELISVKFLMLCCFFVLFILNICLNLIDVLLVILR